MPALKSMRFLPSRNRNFELMAPWLAQPVAHRGLHDHRAGMIENSATAFAAAITQGYGIETDLREAGDGEPVAFHDAALDRLTDRSGPVKALTGGELQNIRLRGSHDRIMSLNELLELVGGRTPLLLEIKSGGRAASRFAARISACLASYRGPVAVMSFDPALLSAFRDSSPHTPRGLVSMKHRQSEWRELNALSRFYRTHLLACGAVKPSFIAYDVCVMPALSTVVARTIFALPIFVWTVKTLSQAQSAARYADNIIFEGFHPHDWRRASRAQRH